MARIRITPAERERRPVATWQGSLFGGPGAASVLQQQPLFREVEADRRDALAWRWIRREWLSQDEIDLLFRPVEAEQLDIRALALRRSPTRGELSASLTEVATTRDKPGETGHSLPEVADIRESARRRAAAKRSHAKRFASWFEENAAGE